MTTQHQPPRMGAITTVYRDIRDSVHKYKTEMLRLESELPGQFALESGASQIVEKKRECQMYSRIIQEFAVLAVEAFLNSYGDLRFGQEWFEPKSDRFSIPNKLAQMLRQTSVQTFE